MLNRAMAEFWACAETVLAVSVAVHGLELLRVSVLILLAGGERGT